MKQSYMCKILNINNPAKDIYDVLVQFPLDTQPGQFVHILCGGDALLRRPISICDSGDGWLRFIYQVRGKGTKLLSQYKEGDELDILGPLGQGFNYKKRGDGTAIVIGGGIGIYPLLKLAKALGSNTEAILGFRTKDLITLEDEFYEALVRLAKEREMPVSKLITLIDEKREIANLSSAIRVYILRELLAKLEGKF